MGCSSQQSPLQKVVLAQSLYNDTLQGAITLRQNHVMTDAEAKDFEVVRDQVYQAIQTAKGYAVSNQTVTFQAFEPQLDADLDKLILLVASKEMPKASTQP